MDIYHLADLSSEPIGGIAGFGYGGNIGPDEYVHPVGTQFIRCVVPSNLSDGRHLLPAPDGVPTVEGDYPIISYSFVDSVFFEGLTRVGIVLRFSAVPAIFPPSLDAPSGIKVYAKVSGDGIYPVVSGGGTGYVQTSAGADGMCEFELVIDYNLEPGATLDGVFSVVYEPPAPVPGRFWTNLQRCGERP